MQSQTNKYHKNLAEYFKSTPLYIDGDIQKKPNTRRCVEQPWQQTKAEMWDKMRETICNLDFIQAKCMAQMIYDLLIDYEKVLINLSEKQKKLSGESYKNSNVETFYKKDNKKLIAKLVLLADEILTFQTFININNNSFKTFYYLPHFCIQQARNYAKNGLIPNKASQKLKTKKNNLFLFQHPYSLPKFNPKPPILMRLEGHTQSIIDICIPPDGRKAVSLGNDIHEILHRRSPYIKDGSIKVWDLTNGKCIYEIQHSAQAIDITSDCNIVVLLRGDELEIWDLKTGLYKNKITGLKGRNYITIRITPDGEKIIIKSTDGYVQVWEIDMCKCLNSFKVYKNNFESFSNKSIAITPDSRKIVSIANEKEMNLWDLESGECLQQFEGNNSENILL